MSNDYKILPGQVTQLTTGPLDRAEDAWTGMRHTATAPKLGSETHLKVPPDFSDWMTPRGPCQQCGERPATVVWAPDGTMGAIHGGYQYWCNRCALREQVAHARACADRLPELERQLAEEEARCPR